MKKLISQGIIYFLVATTFVLSQFVFAEEVIVTRTGFFIFG